MLNLSIIDLDSLSGRHQYKILLKTKRGHLLQHEGVGVVVEWYGSNKRLISVKRCQFIVDEHTLATSSIPYEHHRSAVGHQKVQKVAEADSFGSRH